MLPSVANVRSGVRTTAALTSSALRHSAGSGSWALVWCVGMARLPMFGAPGAGRDEELYR